MAGTAWLWRTGALVVGATAVLAGSAARAEPPALQPVKPIQFTWPSGAELVASLCPDAVPRYFNSIDASTPAREPHRQVLDPTDEVGAQPLLARR
jgi:hypothetical protein